MAEIPQFHIAIHTPIYSSHESAYILSPYLPPSMPALTSWLLYKDYNSHQVSKLGFNLHACVQLKLKTASKKNPGVKGLKILINREMWFNDWPLVSVQQ